MAYLGRSRPQEITTEVILDTFTGNGSQTDFVLSRPILNEQSLFINFDGVSQQGIAFTVAGSTVSFSEAPVNGTEIEIKSVAEVGLGFQPTTQSIFETHFDPTLDGRILKKDVANTVTKGYSAAKVSLTDAATVTIDLDDSNAFDLTLGGTRTLAFPSPVPAGGGVWYIDVTVPTAQTYSLNFNAAYNIVNGVFAAIGDAVNRVWLVARTTGIVDVYIERLV